MSQEYFEEAKARKLALAALPAFSKKQQDAARVLGGELKTDALQHMETGFVLGYMEAAKKGYIPQDVAQDLLRFLSPLDVPGEPNTLWALTQKAMKLISKYKRALKFYAAEGTWETPFRGFSHDPEADELWSRNQERKIEKDGGAKARRALKKDSGRDFKTMAAFDDHLARNPPTECHLCGAKPDQEGNCECN